MAIPSDASNLDMKKIILELTGTPYGSAVPGNLEEWDWNQTVNNWTSNSNSSAQPANKYSMTDWVSYDHFAVSSFVNNKAVSKTTATSATHSINFVDTDDTFNFRGGTEWTISFWVKAGWSSNLNTNIHFIIGQKENAPYQLTDMIKILYHENTNRIEARYGNKTTSSNAWYKMGQWLFHSNSGAYAAGYAAAGLGSTFWSSSNRGYVNSDNYTMITITKSTTNSAAAMKLYWNANSAGAAPLQTNSGSGSPAMSSTNNRSWSLGSNGVSNGEVKAGGTAATVYNDLSIFQKELSASEVTELYNSGTAMDVTTHSAANKLKGYWKFEGNGNATTSNDNFSINGQSGIVNK